MSGAAFFDLYTDPPPTETALLAPVAATSSLQLRAMSNVGTLSTIVTTSCELATIMD
jgi:hypothetical protein